MRQLHVVLASAIMLSAGTAQAQSLANPAPERSQVSVTAPEPATANKAYAGTIHMAATSSSTCHPGESGVRRQIFNVNFPRPFGNDRYVVSLGIRGIDVSNGENLRIETYVQNKAANLMTLVAQTWCTTSIYGANIDYMAVGE